MEARAVGATTFSEGGKRITRSKQNTDILKQETKIACSCPDETDLCVKSLRLEGITYQGHMN
jgi:hypothetical protein